MRGFGLRPFVGVSLSVVCFGLSLGACSSSGGSSATGGSGSGTGGASATGGNGVGQTGGQGTSTGGAGGAANPSGQIPIVNGQGPVPFALGTNAFGIRGDAFYAEAPKDVGVVVLDNTQQGKLCLKGTVPVVPTPADGSHPPYSDYWGVDLGFNLNQDPAAAAAAAKTPWTVPANVTGFWFRVEGATIPPLRFKTTPTGTDPSKEEDSCAIVDIATPGVRKVLFADMYKQCWDGAEGTGPTELGKGLLDIGFQIAADVNGPIPVDFCITALGVIVP